MLQYTYRTDFKFWTNRGIFSNDMTIYFQIKLFFMNGSQAKSIYVELNLLMFQGAIALDS